MKNLEELRAFIQSQMEDRFFPDAVSEWAAKHNGKPLTVRSVPAGLTINKRYGMTQLETPRDKDGGYRTFLIAHSTVNVLIPTVSVLREKNPAYYSGLEERNIKRLELTNNRAALSNLFSAYLSLSLAANAYRAAVKVFEDTCDYPSNTPDYYELRKLAGWIEEKR